MSRHVAVSHTYRGLLDHHYENFTCTSPIWCSGRALTGNWWLGTSTFPFDILLERPLKWSVGTMTSHLALCESRVIGSTIRITLRLTLPALSFHQSSQTGPTLILHILWTLCVVYHPGFPLSGMSISPIPPPVTHELHVPTGLSITYLSWTVWPSLANLV